MELYLIHLYLSGFYQATGTSLDLKGASEGIRSYKKEINLIDLLKQANYLH